MSKPRLVSADGGGAFVDVVERELAKQRILTLTGTVDPGMAHEAGMRLQYLAGISKKPITLYLNTPGGNIVDGLAIFDLIQRINKEVPVDIVATGSCMSMGTIILQAGRKRLSTPNTYFMLHELSAGMEGKLGDQKDLVKHLEVLQKRLNSILSSRTGLTHKELMKKFDRKDYYMDATEALKVNLIDGIVGGE